MSAPMNCQLIGRWRIVEAAIWDRDYLDLVEPAYLQIGNDGWAEFAFGAVNATAELEYGPASSRSAGAALTTEMRSPVADPSSCNAMAQ